MYPENCNRCGLCCTQGVRITDDEIKKIKKLGISEKEFVDDSSGEKLLKRVNGVCMFLDLEADEPTCKIYESRPEICQDFPYSKRCSFGANPMFKVSVQYKQLKDKMEKETGLKAPEK